MRGFARRAAWSAAVRMGLQVYEPNPESLPRLDELTEYVEDARPIGDERPTTATDELPDLTLVPDALGRVVDVAALPRRPRARGGPEVRRPRALDRPRAPAVASSSSPTSSRTRTCTRRGSARSTHRTASCTATSARRRSSLELEPFDLVFFLGVLYHSIHHLPLLGMLNRVTRPGGTMLFETTVDPRPDALVRLRWPENGKAKGVPTVQAVGSSSPGPDGARSTRFTDYRRRLERGALPVREDRRAARRRRSLGRRDSAPSSVASGRMPELSTRSQEPSSTGFARPISPADDAARATRRRLPAQRARRGQARGLRASRLDLQRDGRRRVPPLRGAEHGRRRLGRSRIATSTSRRRGTTCRGCTRRSTRSA